MVYGYFYMNAEERLILMIARSVAYPEEERRIENILKYEEANFNWDRFIRLVKRNGLFPLTYIALKDKFGLLPVQTCQILKKSYLFNLIKNTLFWNEFLILAKVFNELNISFVPLKGLSFIGSIYPDINYRSMVDIDILIKKESFRLVEDILLTMGYKKDLLGLKEEYWQKKQIHIMFEKKISSIRIVVEIHWDLDFKRLKDPMLPELWLRTKERYVKGHKIRFLSWEDTIFSLALHKRRFGNILSLKEACDLACILSKVESEIDWDYMLKSSDIYRMSASVYFVLSHAKLLLDSEFICGVLKKLDISRWQKNAIDKLIIKNTFCDSFDGKMIYLKAHFLLYDSLWEPIGYILNIPKEQFAKYYNLKPYTKQTNLLYKIRCLYMLKNLCCMCLKTIIQKLQIIFNAVTIRQI